MDPEDCVLVAFDTGDGWALIVEDQDGNGVCYLKWPDSRPKTMTIKQLEKYGFKVV